MPILKDFRATKEISLPSFPDSKVVIYDSLIVGEMAQIDFKSDNQLKISIETLPHFIKEWNFTDENEQPLEVSLENLNFLKMDDFKFLSEEIMKFTEENKKKANS